MDFQAFVDCIDAMTCVISVEMKEDGKYGDIRLVAGNQAYIRSIESPGAGPELMMNKFIPGSLYQNYFPQDLNFETVCYRAAVEKVPVHTYVHPDRYDFWFTLFLMPLLNEGNIYYCSYTQEISQEREIDKMAGLSHSTNAEVLATCIKLHGSNDFVETMNSVLGDIRELSSARTCCIMLLDESKETCTILAEARSANAAPTTARSAVRDNPEFYQIVRTWKDTIDGSNCLIVKNQNDMDYVREKNPVWHNSLVSSGVWSIALFPLKTGKDLLGYLWATNFKTEDAEHIKETLELTTYFVTSAIANHLLLNRLKVLSSIDMLTGVMNRNEMNNRIDRIASGEDRIHNLGIIFADVNGLKQVNDHQGHVFGDRLLQKAASVLRELLPAGEIFRAGGDEFMALLPDTTEETLVEFEKKIHESSLGFGYSCFAAGWCFIEDSSDILNALHISDERMYEDKERFYQEHPELRR